MAITSSMTASDVITTALEMVGATSVGVDPGASPTLLALKHLNWMLKTWEAIGLCNQWRVQSVEISWLAATPRATLNTNYLDVANVRYRDASGNDLMLTQLSLEEYAALPNKTTVGNPTSYMVRKTQSTLELNIWPVPAAAVTLEADASRVMTDVTTISQALDVPQEWTETVYICLAARLTFALRTAVGDPAGAQAIQARAAELFALLKAFDDESASLFVQPAYRYG